jgi:hypothetical protein
MSCISLRNDFANGVRVNRCRHCMESLIEIQRSLSGMTGGSTQLSAAVREGMADLKQVLDSC